MEHQWLEWAKKIQSIAQIGLTYGKDVYDLERYEELRQLSVEMMAAYTDTKFERIPDLFANETGYATPKVDIRAVVFREGKLLLVREKIDGAWSLPGGWADIGLTPAEVAVKEVREESGFDVKPVRLLGILDKKCHPHPPSPYHVYKIFIRCDITGGQASQGVETSDVGFFGPDELPELSTERNTAGQIGRMFEFWHRPDAPVLLD